MDKLKQVQKYQFWILLSVALILPLVGWFMATSGLSADVENRTKTIKDLHAKVTTTPPDPNQEWKKGIEAINVEQSKQKNRAWRYMWEQQEPLMTWPAKMPSDPEKIRTNQQEYWRTNYRKFLLELRQKVNPLDDDNPTGWVVYPEELLPNPDSEWVYQAPSIAQIVASQEDLWLLDSLLTSIALVNVGSTSFHDAPIREIQRLYLRGGSPKGAGGGGTATKSTGGSSAGGPGAAAMGEMARNLALSAAKSNEGMGGLMGGGPGGGGSKINSAEISADEDLGAERAAAVPKGATTTDKSAPKGGLITMPATIGPISSPGGGSSSSAGWSGSDKNRYRDDKDDLAWKTRGFHLEVIMDHRQVPELLTRLVDSTWRVTILRVQMSDIYGEDMPDVGSGTAGNRGGLTSGMPPGGPGRGGAAAMMDMMKKSGQKSGPMLGSGGKTTPGRATTPRFDEEGGESASAQAAAAKEDPNLAHVAIVGLIYIAKKPPEEKTPATPPAPGGSSNTPPAANSPTPPAVAGPGKTNGTEANSAEATAPATGAAEEETMTEEPAEDATDRSSPSSEDAKPEADKSPADAGAAGAEGKK